MLSWVVKVVPHPPEPPPKSVPEQEEVKPTAAPPPAVAPPPAAAPPPVAKTPPVTEKKVTFQDECRPEAPKADKLNQEAPAEDNGPAGSQPGVLMWISTALPQPVLSPKLSRANSTTKEEPSTSKPEDQKGMIAWIAQGLEMVVPQPDLTRKEPPAAEQPAQQVHQTAAAKAAGIHVTVVEAGSDRDHNKPLPPRMMDWIKQGLEKVVPQPEIQVRSKTQVPERTEAPPKAEAPAPKPDPVPKPDPAPKPLPAPKPAADPEKSSKEAEPQPNMMGWIASEIGRRLPQPVLKQDAGSDQVHSRGE